MCAKQAESMGTKKLVYKLGGHGTRRRERIQEPGCDTPRKAGCAPGGQLCLGWGGCCAALTAEGKGVIGGGTGLGH